MKNMKYCGPDIDQNYSTQYCYYLIWTILGTILVSSPHLKIQFGGWGGCGYGQDDQDAGNQTMEIMLQLNALKVNQ